MKGWREPSFEKIMNGCRLRVCGVLWTRISVKKRRPRALDSAQRLLHFLLPYSSICLPLFPLRDHLVTSFFTSITSLSFCFHSFFHSSPLFSNGEFHRLAFVFFLHPSFFLPLSRIPLPRSTRAEDRRTYMPAASRIPLLAHVCCSNSFVPLSGHFLLLFCPSSATLWPLLSLFSQSLFSFSPRFNGCTRVRSPRLREASSGLDWKAADFYPLLVFFYRYARPLCILFCLSLSPSLFCSTTRVQKKRS